MAYTVTSVTVASTGVPVSIMAPGNKIAWFIRLRSSATVTILLFPYSGALPGSPPSQSGVGNGVVELSAGQFVNDNDPMNANLTDAMSQGWAAVLNAAGSVVVDSTFR